MQSTELVNLKNQVLIEIMVLVCSRDWHITNNNDSFSSYFKVKETVRWLRLWKINILVHLLQLTTTMKPQQNYHQIHKGVIVLRDYWTYLDHISQLFMILHTSQYTQILGYILHELYWKLLWYAYNPMVNTFLIHCCLVILKK